MVFPIILRHYTIAMHSDSRYWDWWLARLSSGNGTVEGAGVWRQLDLVRNHFLGVF